MRPLIIEFASNALSHRGGEPPAWPRTVEISFAESGPAVLIGEGVGHGAAGGRFTPEEALLRRTALLEARGEWLIPYLERMARGETVTQDELVERFEQLHGRRPRFR